MSRKKSLPILSWGTFSGWINTPFADIRCSPKVIPGAPKFHPTRTRLYIYPSLKYDNRVRIVREPTNLSFRGTRQNRFFPPLGLISLFISVRPSLFFSESTFPRLTIFSRLVHERPMFHIAITHIWYVYVRFSRGTDVFYCRFNGVLVKSGGQRPRATLDAVVTFCPLPAQNQLARSPSFVTSRSRYAVTN